MPFNAEQISYAGKAAMDFIVKKAPEDIYNIDRPLLKLLRKNQKSFPGSKQYINEKLRVTNDSNFQWFGPDNEVTYNRKRTLAEANFAWGSAHDGFALTEEELLQNYISMTDDRDAAPTTDETKQFVNLITENTDTLKEGFKEKFDYDLHLDGTQDPDAIPGLDLLVSTQSTAGLVGGINRGTTPAWRNYSSGPTVPDARMSTYTTGIPNTAGVLVAEMEKAWRYTTRIGGQSPNVILAGSKAIDAYRIDAYNTIERHVIVSGKSGTAIDAGGAELTFRGIPIVWDPVMDDLQTALGLAEAEWDKRMYFLNSKTIRLRPAEGEDMVVRRPPRVYNRYTHYWGLTWRGAMTTIRPTANAVLWVA